MLKGILLGACFFALFSPFSMAYSKYSEQELRHLFWADRERANGEGLRFECRVEARNKVLFWRGAYPVVVHVRGPENESLHRFIFKQYESDWDASYELSQLVNQGKCLKPAL